jgi:hypothetical protein
MLRYSSLPFKTKYRELLKDATSIGSMLSSMSWMEPVPVIRHACMEILREPLNIGLIGSFLRDSPVCWMETIPGVQPDCLHQYAEVGGSNPLAPTIPWTAVNLSCIQS